MCFVQRHRMCVLVIFELPPVTAGQFSCFLRLRVSWFCPMKSRTRRQAPVSGKPAFVEIGIRSRTGTGPVLPMTPRSQAVEHVRRPSSCQSPPTETRPERFGTCFQRALLQDTYRRHTHSRQSWLERKKRQLPPLRHPLIGRRGDERISERSGTSCSVWPSWQPSRWYFH